MMKDLELLAYYTQTGDYKQMDSCVQALLAQCVAPEEILADGIMQGMAVVGEKFDHEEYFIPDMLRAARAAKRACETLRPLISAQSKCYRGKMVLGTVQGDLHDIGKNIVAMTMAGMGIEVVDLGTDVPPEQFVAAVEQDPEASLVGVSALLTVTMPAMERTVKALKSCKVADRITVFVGGAPITQAFADQIGADVFTETAFDAAKRAREILDRHN